MRDGEILTPRTIAQRCRHRSVASVASLLLLLLFADRGHGFCGFPGDAQLRVVAALGMLLADGWSTGCAGRVRAPSLASQCAGGIVPLLAFTPTALNRGTGHRAWHRVCGGQRAIHGSPTLPSLVAAHRPGAPRTANGLSLTSALALGSIQWGAGSDGWSPPQQWSLIGWTVITAQLAAIAALCWTRTHLDRTALNDLALSILLTLAAELARGMRGPWSVRDNPASFTLSACALFQFYRGVRCALAPPHIAPASLTRNDGHEADADGDALTPPARRRGGGRGATERRADAPLPHVIPVVDERELAIASQQRVHSSHDDSLRDSEQRIAGVTPAETLRESEAPYRSMVEQSPVATMVVSEGRVIFRNAESERLFGPRTSEFAFQDLGEIEHEDRSTFAQLCAAMGSPSGSRQSLDFRFYVPSRAGDKALRWVRCRTNPIAYRGRTMTLVSMVDITQLKDLEQLVAIRDNLASIGQLATGIAHEIRSPLSGINLNLSTIETLCAGSRELPPAVRDKINGVVGQAKSASDRIASVVERVMDFARPVPPSLDLIDLNRVVEAAAEFSFPGLHQAGIELRKQLWAGGLSCMADFRLLEQVLLNLITNAAQAMAGVPGAKRLELATAVHGNTVAIMVSDSGPGVPRHLRERIFEPFYSTREDGNGVGLSFSHRVIADHGGRLTVSASRWGGAEFRITLIGTQGTARA